MLVRVFGREIGWGRGEGELGELVVVAVVVML